MESVFFVPSNRDASAAIASFGKECQFALERFGRTVPFVVSETNEERHVGRNAEALREVGSRYPDIPFYHLTVERQQKYFDILLKGQPEAIRQLFYSQEKNYGTAQNKLFLLTASFGAQALHRRDSDCVLVSDTRKEVPPRYPIEVEIEFLGKRISETTAQWQSEADASMGDGEILVVGGNTLGEWAIDVKDFARRSFDIIYHLYEILGFEKESIVEICSEAFRFDQAYEDKDVFSLVTSVNDGLNPDCANHAIYKLHEIFPNVPGRNMLAADYFTFDTATALGLPAVHHTRPLVHEYESGRFEPTQKLRYWEGMARFADYFNQYGPLYGGELGLRVKPTPPLSVPDEILRCVRQEVVALRAGDLEERRVRIERMADEILIPFDEKYAVIGRHLKDNAARYVRESNEDYALHALLLEQWPTLIERAKQIDLCELYA